MFCKKTTKERKDIFFMGDFNLNLLNYDTHSETNDFINLMMTHYLLPHILHPTPVTDHSATIIDNIFTDITEFNSKSGNILCEITDHYPQFIIAEKNIVDYKSCSFAKRDSSSFNEGKFVDDYTSLDLDMLHKHDISIDNKFDYFYQNLSDLVDRHVPSKKMTKKDIKLYSKPWINSKIVRLIRYRDRLKRKLKRKFTSDIEFLYKKFRNRVVSELRTSRAAYHNQYFLTHKDNMKKLWSGIRSIINIEHKTTLNISQLVMDSTKVTDPKHTASAFNCYFVNAPQQFDKAIPRTKKSPIDYLKDRNGHSIFLNATDPLETETIIVF